METSDTLCSMAVFIITLCRSYFIFFRFWELSCVWSNWLSRHPSLWACIVPFGPPSTTLRLSRSPPPEH